MTVIACDVRQCPYNKDQFCAKRGVVKINDNGTCATIYQKRNGGYILKDLSREVDEKENIIVINVAENELHDVTKEENGEEVRPVQENS